MHRTLLLALALLAAAVAPAFAQDAAPTDDSLAAARQLYAETEMSPAADLALYCGAGFHLLAGVALKAGSAEAETFEGLSRTFLARADRLLTAEGFDFDQRSQLAEAVTRIANEEVVEAAGKPHYSKDECIAAVPRDE
jgi:hypothetical protein